MVELEVMETFRNWMEDPKGDEYHRFQTFDFVFTSAVGLAFETNFKTAHYKYFLSTVVFRCIVYGRMLYFDMES